MQMCKMTISPGVFYSMLKFWFSRFSRTWEDKKWPKMSKFSVCHTLYFRNHMSYYLHLWHTCMYESIIYPAIFSIFFKILIFRIIRGGGKMAKKDPKWQKNLSVSQESYNIWLSFLVHVCETTIFPANFFIFQNLDFCSF